jgi:type I restriction enzyme M protein
VLATVSGQQLPRTSWSAMGQIVVPMFSVVAQNQMIPAIDGLEQSIATAQTTIAAAPAQKQAILQKYL